MRTMLLRKLVIIGVAALALIAPLFASEIASALTPHNGAYVALGDSVTAGDGLVSVPNPTNIDRACGLSAQAYPVTVSHATGMPYVNAGCSGAVIGNLSSAQNANGVSVRPQLDTAFSYGVPSMISITAGANDAHWKGMLVTCFASTCGTSAQSSLEATYIAQAGASMHAQLQQIKNRSLGNPPLTLVTGYYDPLGPTCTSYGLKPAEINWVASEVASLNATIKNSLAGFSFARYVPVTFQGHSMCDPTPWVQNIVSPAPFHPNATGQTGYAFVVLVAYNQAKAAGVKF